MNQIYHFDSFYPPVLNEAMLRRERERRRQQRSVAAAAVGGTLILLCLLTLALLLFPIAPQVSIILSLYLTLSVMGASAVALVFLKQRRTLSCS